MTRIETNEWSYDRALKEHLEELEDDGIELPPGVTLKKDPDWRKKAYDPGEFGCYDYDGINYQFHKIGDTWSNFATCNKKTCVAHDTIKEERCPPEINEEDVPEGCRVMRGRRVKYVYDYPYCCERVVCRGEEEYESEEEFERICPHKNRIRRVGEQWADRGKCHRNTCHKYNLIVTEKCPKLKIPRGCNITDPDLDKEFPDCCSVLVCPKDKDPALKATAESNVETNTQQESTKNETQDNKDSNNQEKTKNKTCVII